MEEGKSSIKTLVGRPKGNRPLGRSKGRRMDLEVCIIREIWLNRLMIGLLESPFEWGIEPLGPINHVFIYIYNS